MIQVSLVSPERILFEGEAKYVCLPGSKAPFTVHKGHAPVVSMLDPGILYISTENDLGRYAIDGGFAEVIHDKVTILIERARTSLEIDPDEEKEAIQEISKRIATTDEEIRQKEKELEIHRVRLRLIEKEFVK
ncbi:MAG: ATP synthase F1 subunit epsilon [Candidatus Hydrogenedentota bacterium]|nr:MAG: ATP synthase F1 subunit epsilon [Candidatus Hydrogenedentota bacterium]